MKTILIQVLSAAGLTLAAEASAAAILPVPDGVGGLVQTRLVSEPLPPLAGLRVTLDLAGPDGFLGDLFVTLQHESGAYAVLLNRPGRDAIRPEGYGDQGLNVTFDLAGPDIHTYRETLGGPPAGGLLTGIWSADGRTADPAAVETGSPRNALLSAFQGVEPQGEWILFLADVNPGGQVFLNSWDLEFTPIPEPRSGLLLATCLSLTALLRRRGRGQKVSRSLCFRSAAGGTAAIRHWLGLDSRSE